MLKTKLKLGSISNLGDARFAAGVGADWVGFCFELNNPQYINPETASAIMGWLEGPQLVGEFDIQDAEEVNQLAETMKLDAVQISEPRDRAFLSRLQQPVFLRVDLAKYGTPEEVFSLLKANADVVDYYLLYLEVTEQAVYLKQHGEQLAQWAQQYPLLLDFDFTGDNILNIIREVKPAGVNLKGGEEEKPGFRDFDELIEMVEIISEEGL